MAGAGRSRTVRRSTSGGNYGSSRKNTYVDGNTVRRLQAEPLRYPDEERSYKKASPYREPRQLSDSARRNREKAMGIGRSYVIFLVAVCIAILYFSVNYLQLQTRITSQKKVVNVLESELSQLREDNDAYYSQVTSNVDMTSVRKIAIGRLGMKYASDDQIVTYETEGRSYVRQYQDVPDSK